MPVLNNNIMKEITGLIKQHLQWAPIMHADGSVFSWEETRKTIAAANLVNMTWINC